MIRNIAFALLLTAFIAPDARAEQRVGFPDLANYSIECKHGLTDTMMTLLKTYQQHNLVDPFWAVFDAWGCSLNSNHLNSDVNYALVGGSQDAPVVIPPDWQSIPPGLDDSRIYFPGFPLNHPNRPNHHGDRVHRKDIQYHHGYQHGQFPGQQYGGHYPGQPVPMPMPISAYNPPAGF